MRYLRWIFFFPVACFFAWRIVVLGLAEYYVNQGDGATHAVTWYPSHSQALLAEALQLMDKDPVSAERLLYQAAWQNPTDGRIYMALARHWEANGEKRQAADLVSVASKLAPMRARVQLQAADFWLRQGQIDKALVHWSVALRLEPAIRDRLYPLVLQLLENSATRPAFVALLQDPPEWWEDFFDYAANQAITLDTLRGVYAMRSGDSHPLSVAERSSFMRRLEREKQWLELYFVWLSSLDPQQLRVLGNVYNGSFELPLADPIGFDWRAPKIRGVTVETAPTYGIRGNKALHVVFQGLRVHFQHLYQYLLLDPGKYQLRGWVRPEALQTERGVQWTVSCVGHESDVLGTSDRFLGSDQWRSFIIDFTVPATNCQVQLLRLELAGRVALEFEARGSIWFENLAITRVE